MSKQDAREILNRYREGVCTEEEKAQVETYYNLFDPSHTYDLSDAVLEAELMKLAAALPVKMYRPRQRIWPFLAAAASLVLVVGVVWITYHKKEDKALQGSKMLANIDVPPGSNKAVLTLSNGSRITLTDAANGAIANQAGVQITKTANGQLIYSALSSSPSNHPASPAPSGRGGEAGEGGSNSNNSSLPSGISPQRGERGVALNTGLALNTIETPRGGQYQVRLPDGSKVWLNAASKLIYPASFNGREDRRVELSGEAYFEVAKDKQHPFKVKTNSQEVQVLGTHFNINSYADEGNIKTTLVEGSVKVSSSNHPASLAPPGRGGKAGEGGGNTSLPTGISPQSGERGLGTILKPGQQATLTSNQIKVADVDVSLAVAWKNGQFAYKNAPLETVMQQIARWYDVDIIYTNPQSKLQTFSGTVSRYDNVSKILKAIEYTGSVKFKMEGRKIIIN